MYLKRYRKETVQEALACARRELGPNALVLSTRLVQVPGVRGWMGAREVELTAAIDRSADDPLSDSRLDDLDEETLAEVGRALRGAAARGGRGTDPEAHRTAERVLRTAGGRGPRPADRPERGADRHARGRADVIARLCASGLDEELADEVADALPPAGRRGASPVSLQKTLAERLASLAAPEEPYAPIEVFVGPAGVGKTTTVAKIAAQERARKGTRIGLVSTDGYRVGAVEQLRLYADIIGTPFVATRTPGELEFALASSGRPLLIDTAGRAPGDRTIRDLFELLAGRAGVRTHLVLPATSSARDVARIFDGYRSAKPERVVLTRIDEADSLSPLVGVLRDRQVRISYLSTGQRVPEDLSRATAERLAACVLGESHEMAERLA